MDGFSHIRLFEDVASLDISYEDSGEVTGNLCTYFVIEVLATVLDLRMDVASLLLFASLLRAGQLSLHLPEVPLSAIGLASAQSSQVLEA